MTSADVVYSFEHLLRPDSVFAFAFAGLIDGSEEFQQGKEQHLRGVTASDDTTIEFKLTRPDIRFPYRCTSPWVSVIASEAVEKGGEFGNTHFVGTGPFLLSERRGNDIILRRNPNYWRKTEGNIEELIFRTIKEDQIRLLELQNHHIDAMFLPAQLAAGVLAHPPRKSV